MASPSKTISVRFSKEHQQQLAELAEAHGVSVSEYLRDAVAAHLESPDKAGVAETVQETHDEVRRLRSELSRLHRSVALALETILVNFTDGDEAEIRDLVRKLMEH